MTPREDEVGRAGARCNRGARVPGQETKRRRLNRARKVFGARRFHGATIEQIADEAGLSNGAIYYNRAGVSAVRFPRVARPEAGDLFAQPAGREREPAGVSALLDEVEVEAALVQPASSTTRNRIGANARLGPEARQRL